MPDASLLAVDLKVRQAALALHVRFETNAPWTCLFGASGSGKTTVLRAIAGLVRPDGGSVRVGGQVITDVAGGVRVAPHRRGLRMAAQQAYLFRGSVQRNVGYAARAEIVEELLERFRLTPLAETDVSRLSGGERQRVSLARAVGAAVAPADGEPVRLLLLDEPFTGMDAALRDQLAEELRDWLAEARVPVLSVTHDVAETFLLRAEVVRLGEGRVLAQGAAAEVLAEERLRLLNRLG